MSLSAAFHRYARATSGWLPPPVTLLAPGLPPTEITQRLQGAGLPAPGAVLEWFGRANGLVAPTSQHQVYIGATPLSLLEALRYRDESLSTLDVEQWSPFWLPFLRYDWAAVACIECAEGAPTAGRAFLYEHISGAAPGTLALPEMLKLWADVIERGLVVQDPERLVPVATQNPREHVPAASAASWLV